MRKGIYVGAIIVLVVSLSFNFFWLLSDKNYEDNEETCPTRNEGFLNIVSQIETANTITDFNYEIHEDDEVRIYLYEYTNDGVHHVLSSSMQLENRSEDLKSNIEGLLAKANGKNASEGFLYGPVYTVKIEIESSDYEMEIMLGERFMTIDLNQDGIHKVFTVENELNTEIKQLITQVKNKD